MSYERKISNHQFRLLIQQNNTRLISWLKYKLKDKLDSTELLNLELGIRSRSTIHLKDKPVLNQEEYIEESKGYSEFINNIK